MTQRLNYATIAPTGIKALGSVYGYIEGSGLPGSLVNLGYLRVSQINDRAYCIDMHSRDLIKEGFAIKKLVLVQAWREAGGLFDARERAALAWAETVTRVADTAVPDDEFMAAADDASAVVLHDAAPRPISTVVASPMATSNCTRNSGTLTGSTSDTSDLALHEQEMEEGKMEVRVSKERNSQHGLPSFDVFLRRRESKWSTSVAPEIGEALTALVMNANACRRWLSADPPNIRQARAAMERMLRNASALTKLACAPGDKHL